MRVSPIVIFIFITGIIINSLGRLILMPLKIPIGLTLTTVGYYIWAGTFAYVCVNAVLQRRFTKRLSLWLLFTFLAPIQFNAARAHQAGLNRVTTLVLVGLLIGGSVMELKLYLQHRTKK